MYDVFQPNKKNWDPLAVFDTLIGKCPQLQTLISGQHFEAYFERLINARKSGQWLNLCALSPAWNSDQIKPYTAAALTYSKSLTILYMYDAVYHEHYRQIVLFQNHYYELAECFDSFKKLQCLQIKRNTKNGLFELERMLDKASDTLETLMLTTYDPPPILPPSENFITTDLSKVKFQPNVHTFEAYRVAMDDAAVNYLIHKLPKLTTLKVNQEDQNFCRHPAERRFNMTAESQEKLFEYISKLYSFDVTGVYEDVSNVLARFVEYNPIKNNFLTFLYTNNKSYILDKTHSFLRIGKHSEYDSMEGAIYSVDDTNITEVYSAVPKRMRRSSTNLQHMEVIEKLGAETFKEIMVAGNRDQDLDRGLNPAQVNPFMVAMEGSL